MKTILIIILLVAFLGIAIFEGVRMGNNKGNKCSFYLGYLAGIMVTLFALLVCGII